MDTWVAFALRVSLQVLGAITESSGLGGVSYLGHLGGTAVGIAAWLARSRRAPSPARIETPSRLGARTACP